MKQVWYNPETMQVEAVYENCMYGGTWRQESGQVAVEMPDDVDVSRDHKLVIARGVVTDTKQSVNPMQPKRQPVEPTETEVLMEAAKSAGLDLAAARRSLAARR